MISRGIVPVSAILVNMNTMAIDDAIIALPTIATSLSFQLYAIERSVNMSAITNG